MEDPATPQRGLLPMPKASYCSERGRPTLHLPQNERDDHSKSHTIGHPGERIRRSSYRRALFPRQVLPVRLKNDECLIPLEVDELVPCSRASSTGTVEIHLPPKPEWDWEMQDTGSENTSSDSEGNAETPSRPPQRIVCVDSLNTITASRAPIKEDASCENSTKSPTRIETNPESVDGICLLNPTQPTAFKECKDSPSASQFMRRSSNTSFTRPPSIARTNITKAHGKLNAEKLESPKISPRVWLRRDMSSGRYFSYGGLGSTALPDHNIVSPRANLPSQVIHIQYAPTFDMVMNLSAYATACYDGGIRIHYHASLVFDFPEHKDEPSAKEASLEIVARNCLMKDETCKLDLGKTSLLLKEDRFLPCQPTDRVATITVIRDIQDLHRPLDLYILVTYPQGQYAVVSIPSFHPSFGKTIAERVFVKKPALPLIMKPLMRGLLSTWVIKNDSDHGSSFERLDDLPPLFPAEGKDDVRIWFAELQPVMFEAFDGLVSPSRTIYKLNIAVERVFGKEIHCCMTLLLMIGSSPRLLTCDPHGWVPSYFLVDGKPASEGLGIWREDEDRLYTLLKQPYMLDNDVLNVELHWQQPSANPNTRPIGLENVTLPRVTDSRILGARLVCPLPNTAVILHSPPAEDRFHDFDDKHATTLPTLQPGYRLNLSMPVLRSSPTKSVRFAKALKGSSVLQQLSDPHMADSEDRAHGTKSSMKSQDLEANDTRANRFDRSPGSSDDSSSSDKNESSPRHDFLPPPPPPPHRLSYRSSIPKLLPRRARARYSLITKFCMTLLIFEFLGRIHNLISPGNGFPLTRFAGIYIPGDDIALAGDISPDEAEEDLETFEENGVPQVFVSSTTPDKKAVKVNYDGERILAIEDEMEEGQAPSEEATREEMPAEKAISARDRVDRWLGWTG